MSDRFVCASVASLMRIKDVTQEDAELIRKIWKAYSYDELNLLSRRPVAIDNFFLKEKRELVDEILRTYGVEFLGRHKRNHYNVYYCNAGDTYTTTVIFTGRTLTVGCWGDLIEKNLIHEFIQI